MKPFIISCAALLAVTLAVFLNSFFVRRCIDTTVAELEALGDGADASDYNELLDRYMKRQSFLALTVNHDDLMNIEDIFFELIGSCEAGDDDGVKVSKSRLLGALSHLRRLSGINFDSIL